MCSDCDIRLLELMWRLEAMTDREFVSFSGQHVRIVCPGECSSENSVFTGAQIVIDGVINHGDVVFGSHISLCDNAVLHVVPESCIPVSDGNGTSVCQICVPIDDLLKERYSNLINGAAERKCAEIIADMDDLRRVEFYTGLLVERMKRKSDEIRSIYAASDFDWGQTLYIMMMRSLGDNKNKEPFAEIARRVPFVTVMREKSSISSVEALLMGASGLLFEYDSDEHILSMSRDFEYLCHKYSLRPLKSAEWNLAKINPRNHPLVRLAEFSALIAGREFVFSEILECRSAKDVARIFTAEASDYWQTHFLPGKESEYLPKKIGTDKAYLMGINLVAPFIFAYSDCRGDETGKQRAIELLESLPAETNSITKAWKNRGAVMQNAFDSQAVLQLNNELCGKKLCDRCLLGRRLIKKSMTSLCER